MLKMYNFTLSTKNKLGKIILNEGAFIMIQRNAFALFLSICLFVFSWGAIHSFQINSVHAFSPRVIQHGAIGDDVIELQARLQYIGFYHGKIDGVFGWGTYWALRNFQSEFGLPIDGFAGDQTKNKLVAATNYDEENVKKQIEQNRSFTHYGKKEANKKEEQQPTGDDAGQQAEN